MSEDRGRDARDGRGVFLVFEGVEGAGKTTHARRLLERLRRTGVACTAVREPGGTATAERIRDVVLDPSLEVGPETELLLLLAARADCVRRLIGPALARGEVVVSDRYDLSTFAYQGIARGLGLEKVRRLNEFATGGLRPDLVVLLRLPPEEGFRRKGGGTDRMERETAAFHERVAKAYEELARGDGDVIVVESDAPVEAVEARVLQELASRWPETFAVAEGLRHVTHLPSEGERPGGGGSGEAEDA